MTTSPEHPSQDSGSPPNATRHHPPKIFNERALVALGRSGQERLSDVITEFAGSMTFVYVHAVWFAGWILMNEGCFGRGLVFDRFPYGLLTMVVSLEAIFLSTFVLISQNRDAHRQNVRSDLDYQADVRAAVWTEHIGRALGLDPAEIEAKVTRLLAETDPSSS
ncbi:DUF1003 domain-containing protein [Pseudofrankia inefficax]|uniref:DUF1003 domain-containing protein n=1 Tax=Pseudofrankia inefficax (strain DSM 45817 / CECT 9037 / DDB 130130 / EuI1c) TaxID=298654 RepID=E3J588_PSEI1|nr:DUF1003 domain-containing protein [Pseudofrankia inefficax]ADP80686.1 protein of unknown function DUF1003 [Pseudofrankia inefficax]